MVTGSAIRVESVEETVDDADELMQVFDELATLPNSRDTFGRAYWLGPTREEPELRVDLDPETGAGAVRWLVDDLVGVEDGYEPRAVIVAEKTDEPLVWIPPVIARVSYAAARAAAIEYVETGRRPDGLDWVEGDQALAAGRDTASGASCRARRGTAGALDLSDSFL